MRVRAVALAAFVTCACLACGRVPLLEPPQGGGAGTTGAAGAQGTGAGGSSAAAGIGAAGSSPLGQAGAGAAGAPPLAGPDCQPTGDRYVPSSIPAMRRALTGTWALCSDLGLFHAPHEALRIGADDRYALLGTQNGALVPLSGSDNLGTVEYIDTSDSNGPNSYQVNFAGGTTGGTVTAFAVLSDVPRLLLITNVGPPFYRYRRLDLPGPNEGATLGAPRPATSRSRAAPSRAASRSLHSRHRLGRWMPPSEAPGCAARLPESSRNRTRGSTLARTTAGSCSADKLDTLCRCRASRTGAGCASSTSEPRTS